MSPAETGQLEALFAEVNSLAIRLRGGPVPARDGFSGGVGGVLRALAADGPHTVPGVARRHRTSRQNIQVVVNRLKNAGLVEMESNPAHKRSCLVRLSEKGKSALGQIRVAESGRLESLLAQIPQDDLACTRRVLSQIRQSLGGRPWNETGQERANLPRSPTRTKAKERRRRYPKLPEVMESTSDDEIFPLNLL